MKLSAALHSHEGVKPIVQDNLKPHYSAFLKEGRLLLTGHSHQAWPDVARRGLEQSFLDASEAVDDKWGKAFEKASRVQEEIARRIGAHKDEIALGTNTHELLVKFLSALPLKERPHIVTTDGEFHSLYRQLCRLQNEGLQVTFVPTAPLDTLAERLAQSITEKTSALMVSTVLFETSAVVPNLKHAVEKAFQVGAEVFLDLYHAFSAMPVRLSNYGDGPVFAVGGGYKYAQWGEGVCFLRVPPGFRKTPVVTGWFSDFEHLHEPRQERVVHYGTRGADVFAGSTYEPASHYRAVEVIRFFEEQGLTLEALRALSLRQTRQLLDGLSEYEVLTPQEDAARGAFVSVRTPHAARCVEDLRERNIFVDARGDILRLGPAPYVSFAELDRALGEIRTLLRAAPLEKARPGRP